MRTRNSLFVLFIFLSSMSLGSISFAFTSNVLPDGLPPNLPSKIKGKYRLIEHDASSSMWVAYDFTKYSRTADGFKMYPPVYTYDYLRGENRWLKRTDHAPLENMYTTELVTIIDAGAKLRQQPGEGKQIPARQAISKVYSSIKSPSSWRLSSKPYRTAKGKDGFIICGKHTINPSVTGIWWCTGNKVTSVNGIAKGNTPSLEMTYDVAAREGLSICGK